jgi:hypothetical protein
VVLPIGPPQPGQHTRVGVKVHIAVACVARGREYALARAGVVLRPLLRLSLHQRSELRTFTVSTPEWMRHDQRALRLVFRLRVLTLASTAGVGGWILLALLGAGEPVESPSGKWNVGLSPTLRYSSRLHRRCAYIGGSLRPGLFSSKTSASPKIST